MQIWAIGTVRNEVDLVSANVRSLIHQGVDRILLVDHESRDGTPDVLSDLSRIWPVEWRRFSGPFRQDVLLTELVREAAHRGADWVVPVDADEFWVSRTGTLRDVLAHTSAPAVAVQPITFIQHRDVRHTSPLSLLSMTRTAHLPAIPADAAEQMVEEERIAYVEHPYPAKWVVRASPAVSFGWGSHIVGGVSGELSPTTEILCLHAPLRSREVLLAKCYEHRPAAEVEDYLNEAWHLRRWRRLGWEGRLEAEWCANSFTDDGLDVFGALHPVQLDSRLADAVRPWLPAASS